MKKQKAKFKETKDRMKQLEREQQTPPETNDTLPGNDHQLINEIEELKNENTTLVDQIGAEKAQAESHLEKKDEELRFLQEELNRTAVGCCLSAWGWLFIVG